MYKSRKSLPLHRIATICLRRESFNMENPWKTLSKAIKYENPWIRVEEHQIINPAGNPGIYGTVNFKNTAVGIVPLFANGDTVSIRGLHGSRRRRRW